MNPTFSQLQSEIASCLHELEVSQTQLRPPSHSDKWSIQQIIEHLLLTYAETETALNARIVKGTPTRAKPSLTQRVAQFAVCRFGYFPSGRKAPPLVIPIATSSPLSGRQLAQATAERLERLDQRCVQAAELFGSTSRCASHIVLGPLSIDQWRSFQLIHGKHHLKQIAAIHKAYNLWGCSR